MHNMFSTQWLLATVLISYLLYSYFIQDDNTKEAPLVETDCGTILGAKDPEFGVYTFKVESRALFCLEAHAQKCSAPQGQRACLCHPLGYFCREYHSLFLQWESCDGNRRSD